MENLHIYKVSDHYIRYLHSRDHKVQYNKMLEDLTLE